MKKLFSLFLLFAASQTFAGAVYTIGFGDTTDQFIMDYKGFYWSGSYNGTDLNSHWVNAQCCGNNPPDIPNAPLGYAWSNGATDILDFESKDTSAFNFLSFDIYGDTNLHGGRSEPIAVKGFLDDILLYSVVLPALDTLSRTAFTTFDLNWAGINNVQYSNITQNIYLTNLKFEEVPSPAPLALITFGLAGIITRNIVRGSGRRH